MWTNCFDIIRRIFTHTMQLRISTHQLGENLIYPSQQYSCRCHKLETGYDESLNVTSWQRFDLFHKLPYYSFNFYMHSTPTHSPPPLLEPIHSHIHRSPWRGAWFLSTVTIPYTPPLGPIYPLSPSTRVPHLKEATFFFPCFIPLPTYPLPHVAGRDGQTWRS
jgi:hypothetical protein